MSPNTTTNVQLTRPSGINGTLDATKPWEFLMNLMPTERGWESAPGLEDTPGRVETKGQLAFISSFFDGEQEVLVRAGVSKAADESFLIYLTVVDSSGASVIEVNSASDDAQILSGAAWRDVGQMSAASLNGRLFFSAGGDGVWVLSRRLPPNNPIAPTVANFDVTPYKLRKMHFGRGVNSANWPYLERVPYAGAPLALRRLTPFGAPILEAHNQRVFYAGFKFGQKVTFDQALSAAQRYLMPDHLESEATITVNPQFIIWTDPDDPFSIGLPNFIQINTAYRITALASWRDRLIIFTTGDVWVLTGHSEQEYAVRRIANNIGCQDAHTVAVAMRGVYFGNGRGIYFTNGEAVQRISEPIEHLFDNSIPWPSDIPQHAPFTASSIPMTQLRTYYGAMQYISGRNEVWIPVKCDPGGEFLACLVYNDRLAEWTLVKQAGLSTGYDSIGIVGTKQFVIDKAGYWMSVNDENCHRDPTTHVITAQETWMISKPMRREVTAWHNAQAVTLLWRKSPDGESRANASWVYGDEEAYAGTDVQRHTFDGNPPWLSTDYEWDGFNWDEGLWTGRPWVKQTIPLGFQVQSPRVCVYTNAKQRIELRGIVLLLKQVALAPGGE